MFAFFFKRNHTFDTEKRGCVKTLAQPLLYFTVLLYFLLAMLLFPHAFGNKCYIPIISGYK